MSKQEILDRPNILVAGGAGFLGSNLCEYLLQRYNVICVDNYFSGTESNIDKLLSHKHFEFIRHDITEPLDFKHVLGLERFRVAYVGVQAVVHCALSSSPRISSAHPVETMISGSLGTKQVLDFALEYRARVIALSDARVYGQAPLSPAVLEDLHGPLDYFDPLNTYAEVKRFAESLIESYRRTYNLSTSIVRLSTVFGPNMHPGDGRLMSDLIDAALHHRDILVPKGFEECSFLYVSDACDAIEKLIRVEKTGVYNLGHTTAFSLREVVEKIIALTGSKSSVSGGEISENEVGQYRVWREECRMQNVAKIKDAIGWFPIVFLEEGLSKTVDFMKALRGVREPQR